MPDRLTPKELKKIADRWHFWGLLSSHEREMFACADIPALLAEIKALTEERDTRIAQAIKFLVHEDEESGKRIYIDKCISDDRGVQWAVRDGFGSALTTHGRWVDEPSPSSRTDEFRAEARFDTLNDAYAAVSAKLGNGDEIVVSDAPPSPLEALYETPEFKKAWAEAQEGERIVMGLPERKI